MERFDPRQQEAIARFIEESTSEVVVVSDADAVARWVSPSAARVLGWTAERLESQRTPDYVHPDDIPILMDLRSRADDGHVLMRIRNGHGGYTWCRVSSRQISDVTGAPALRVSIFHDVDAEVQAQRALAESEHWYRLLAENLTDFVTMASPDGTLTWASPSAAAVLGWTPEEVYGRPTASFLHPDDIPRLIELRTQMAEGRASLLRARVQRADGTYRWFDLSIKPVYEDGALIGRATAYRDVQAEVEAQAALAASERQFRLLAENAADVVILGHGDVITWASPSLTAALGWSPDEWVGGRLSTYAHPDDVAPVGAEQGTAVERATRRRYRLRGANGEHHWVDSHAGPYRDDAGDSAGWVASFRVIDDLVRAEQELERRARVDTVTGLINRHEAFERLAERERRTGTHTGVLFCDIDRFKDVNDERGHAAGDEVLRVIGERIASSIRREDVAARIGGDELLVILAGVHDLDEAMAVGESIRKAASEPISLDDGPVTTTLSIGVTIAGIDEDADALVARADEAMYEAKRSGRNRVVGR